MKKKLVAFAVTAAMVITSAVPVFAQTWDKPADPVQVGNVITISEETPRTDMQGTVTADGITFDTVIDLNRDPGFTAFKLNFLTSDQKTSAGTAEFHLDKAGDKYKVLWDQQEVKDLEGIITLEWTVKTTGIELTVFENGYDDEAKGETIKATLPSQTAAYLADLTVTPSGTVVFYEVAPEEIVEVEVVKLNGESGTEILKDEEGNPVIADQAVEGERYSVYSITLDDGTVITDQALMKEYTTLTWKATKDGKDVDISGVVASDGTRFNVKKDRFDGCKITLEVSANKSAGVFGGVVWGAGSDPLAVAERYEGANRYETALAVADALKDGDKFKAIVVASGEEYADALSATAFAAKMEAPILLVNSAYEQKVRDYIYANMLYNGTVYIIGGENAVSKNFEDSIDKHYVERLGGADRYATNLEILKMMKEKNLIGNWTVVVSGAGYADALSAASVNEAILMVGDELTKDQKEFLTANGKKAVVVVGGPLSVNVDVEEEMLAYDTDGKIQRYGGANRYETNYMVLTSGITVGKNMVLASGAGFADGLVGGVLALGNQANVVLANDGATTYAERFAYNNKTANLFVVGGEKSVSNEVVQKVYSQKIAE